MNLCSLRPTPVHNANGKSIGLPFCTAHGRVSSGRLAPPGEYDLNLCILRPARVHNQKGKSIASAVFAQLTAESPYTLQWAPLSPKIAHSHRGPRPDLTHDSLGPFEPITNGIFIGSAVFAQMTAVLLYPPLSYQNYPFPWGSGPHLINGSWAYPSPQPRNLDRFSRFCRAQWRLTSVTD